MSWNRRGFIPIERLVVMAVLSLLVALLLAAKVVSLHVSFLSDGMDVDVYRDLLTRRSD